MKNKINGTNWRAKTVKGATFALGAAAGALLVSKTINKSKKLEFKDKVILITGGGRGLGIILARKLAELGATIVICGRSGETLQKAAMELSVRTDKYLEIPCDITNKEEVKRLVHQVKNEVGSIDILINNASIIKVGPMETLNQLDYEEAMNTHFWGPFYLINEVLPEMKEKGSGSIVNIASIGSKVSFPHLIPYNASKFALSGFSEGLGTELKKYNINVTTVYPGLMRTGSPRNIDVKGQHKKEYAWFKISDSLPLISMDADRAADKIISALRRRKRVITLSLPAKMVVAVHGVAPAVTLRAFDLIESMLPRKKDGEKVQKGYESESKITRSFLTKKTEEAAEKNLEK